LFSAPTGELVGSHRKLRLRSNLQLFHDALTLSCNETGATAKLRGDLFVRFSFGEAPQQLFLLRRELVAVRRWHLQVGPPIRSNGSSSGKITLFARVDQCGAHMLQRIKMARTNELNAKAPTTCAPCGAGRDDVGGTPTLFRKAFYIKGDDDLRRVSLAYAFQVFQPTF
jgi:hypothetical protein